MPQPSNGDIVRRYWKAHSAHDYDELRALRHAEWTTEWPQSNERIRGHDNDRAMAEAYPGGLPGMETVRVAGSDDQWVAGPSFPMLTVIRIAGSGDTWWTDSRLTYPDGSVWFMATLLELRDGKIFRETEYFAPCSEAPEWRRPWVEPLT